MVYKLAKNEQLTLVTPNGKIFLLTEDKNELVATIPNDGRIMYGTENGNNNAIYVRLIK